MFQSRATQELVCSSHQRPRLFPFSCSNICSISPFPIRLASFMVSRQLPAPNITIRCNIALIFSNESPSQQKPSESQNRVSWSPYSKLKINDKLSYTDSKNKATVNYKVVPLIFLSFHTVSCYPEIGRSCESY